MINIKLRVKNLIKKYGTPDPYWLAKCLNITIVFEDTPSGVNGFFKRVLRRKYIVVNEKIKEEWQIQAIICHEIGHLRCHHGIQTSYCMAGRTYFQIAHKEQEANRFSAAMMSHCSDIDEKYIIDFLENGYKFLQ